MRNEVMNRSKRKLTTGLLVGFPVLAALMVLAAGCSGSGVGLSGGETYPHFPVNARGDATNSEISSD